MHLTRLSKYNGQLTRTDMLKCAALLLMLLDHIGWLFFPEQLWWRAAGRASMPIWAFLVGYHTVTRDGTPVKSSFNDMKLLFVGAIICAITDLATGTSEYIGFFPLSILAGFMLCKWMLAHIPVRRAFSEYPYEWFAALAMLALPSVYFIEYGTYIMLFVCVGYAARRGWLSPDDPEFPTFRNFALLTLAVYAALQWGHFDFSVAEILLMFLCLAPMSWALWHHDTAPRTLSLSLPARLVTLIKLGGRYTLEFYVAHKVALQFLAMV